MPRFQMEKEKIYLWFSAWIINGLSLELVQNLHLEESRPYPWNKQGAMKSGSVGVCVCVEEEYAKSCPSNVGSGDSAGNV